MLLQPITTSSPLNLSNSPNFCYCSSCFKNQSQKTPSLLPKTLFLPSLDSKFYYHLSDKTKRGSFFSSGNGCGANSIQTRTAYATLLETPVLWAGRVCIFYVLLKAGLAGSPANPLISSGMNIVYDDYLPYLCQK